MSYRLGTYKYPPPSAFPASFPLGLAGSTPSPIPSGNTSAISSLTVGSYMIGPGYASIPWLDANLVVRNVTADQAARSVVDTVRNALISTGATVDDVRWVTGGYVYAKWRPGTEESAIRYATRVRDALLQAALQLNSRSQIVMTRFRVNMPALRTDLYVYPTGTVPPPPPPPPGSTPPPVISTDSTSAPMSEGDSGGGVNYVVLVGALGVLSVLGGVGYYVSRRRQPVQRNRGRRRRVRR